MFARASERRRAQARRAAQILNKYPASVANEELRILMSTLEDLVDRLGTAADPELKRLRHRAETAAGRVQAAITRSGAQLRDQAGDLAEQGSAYVRARPWTSLGLAALCVLAIGMWTGRAVSD